MAPRTEEQFTEIRNEKIKLIMDTALEAFAQNGYESTSISTIAKAAGISKGLMYNYFPSKVALLQRIIMEGMDVFMQFLEVKDESRIKKEELIQFIDGNLQSLKESTDYYRLYFSLIFQPKVFHLLGNDFMVIFEQLVNKFVLYFTQQGEKNPYGKARFILAIFDGVGIHYISDTEHFPLDEVRDMTVEML